MIRVVIGTTSNISTADAVIFDEQTFSVDAVREAIATSSLFGGTKTIVLLRLLDVFHDDIIDLIKDNFESAHTIILREDELSTADEKVFTKLGVEISGKSAAPKPKQEFNIWSLTDALLARDKKTAWMLYRQAIDAGIAPEEIGGILWWQMKTLLLVAREGNPTSVKPFAVTKAKRALQKYSQEDLARLSNQLITAIHEPRAGNGKAEETLEAFMLSL